MAEPIKIEGLRELSSTLRKMSKGLPKELREINLRRAKMVSQRADTLAPRRTGRLAGSIRPLATQRNARVAVGRGTIPYANVIYWGYPRRNIAPNQFIDRAITQSESTVQRDFENELNAYMKEVWSQWG